MRSFFQPNHIKSHQDQARFKHRTHFGKSTIEAYIRSRGHKWHNRWLLITALFVMSFILDSTISFGRLRLLDVQRHIAIHCTVTSIPWQNIYCRVKTFRLSVRQIVTDINYSFIEYIWTISIEQPTDFPHQIYLDIILPITLPCRILTFSYSFLWELGCSVSSWTVLNFPH